MFIVIVVFSHGLIMSKIHISILEFGRKLGYTSYDNNGTCNGFTLRWLEACFLGEEDIFNRRVERIVTALKNTGSIEQINAVKDKVKAHETLTPEDNNWLDLLAFYESMALYQKPMAHAHVFNKVLSQHDISSSSQLASSKEIYDLGGLTSIYSELGIYTQEEIKDLLYQFETALEYESYPEEASIGFILRNQDHMIGLVYQRDSHLWKLKDINRDSFLLTEEILTAEQLAGAIFQGFKGLYPTMDELEAFLLAKENDVISEQSEKKEQIPISLEHQSQHGNQTEYIIYHTKNGLWQFKEDVEISPTSLINPVASRKEMAQRIFNLVHQKSLQNPYVTFATSAITTLSHEKQFLLSEQLNELKKYQNITKEIASREDAANLACVAASMNDISTIKKLIKLEVNLAQARSHGAATPLHIAAQYGYGSIIKLLQKQGLNPNVATDEGQTPVYFAASYNQAHAIAILAKNGANLNISSHDGCFTPTFIAAQQGHVHVITVLAKYGADLNQVSTRGATPAFVAAQNGHTDVIFELAKYRVNFDIAMDGATPAFVAAQNGHADVIDELAKHHADLNISRSNGTAPIHIAVIEGHVNVIEALIRHGINLNTQMKDGSTSVACAAKNGQIKLISILANYNADLNLPNHEGKTPVILAAEKGDLAMLIELAKYGADINKALPNGMAPIHFAALNGHTEIVEALLNQGVNPDTVSSVARAVTWQEFAQKTVKEGVIRRMSDFIQSKLDSGDSIEKIRIFPKDIAQIMGHEEIVQIFKDFYVSDVCKKSKESITQLKQEAAESNEPKIQTIPSPGRGSSG